MGGKEYKLLLCSCSSNQYKIVEWFWSILTDIPILHLIFRFKIILHLLCLCIVLGLFLGDTKVYLEVTSDIFTLLFYAGL